MAQLRIYLLGRFDVRLDDAVVLDQRSLPQRAAAILKLLAIQPDRTLHRDQICDLLWPELEADAAANAFYKNLHFLRSALRRAGIEEETVRTSRGLVTLAREAWTDVDAFGAALRSATERRSDPAQYEQALSLYGGDLLPQDRYEDWPEAARGRLRAEARRGRAELARIYEREGRLADAAARWEEALADDGVDEEAHRERMRLLAKQGLRGEALRQYERCKEALADELDVKPSKETDELAAAIRREEALLDGGVPRPVVRYTTTEDGFRLAYTVMGDGFPLIHMSQLLFNHLEIEWDIPEWGAWHRRLGAGRMYVRYDGRGRGLSQREGARLRVETECIDLDTIADTLGLEQFDLFVGICSSVPAMIYAAEHPDRVRRMIVLTPWPRNVDVLDTASIAGAAAIVTKDWRTYCQYGTSLALGFGHEALAQRITEMTLVSNTPECLVTVFEAESVAGDATTFLPRVRCPVLVIWRRSQESTRIELVQRVLEALPDARPAAFDGNEDFLFVGDVEGPLAAIREFLDADLDRGEPSDAVRSADHGQERAAATGL